MRRNRAVVIYLVAVLFPSASLRAQVQVGTHIPAEIECPRDYQGSPVPGQPVSVWTHVLKHPGATYIALHFVDFHLAPGDELIICDAGGGQEYRLRERGKMQAGTFWARHIRGDTAALELISVNPAGGEGFEIDEYVAGDPDPGQWQEVIFGDDDRENAICYIDSLPVVYDTCRAACRLLVNGSTLCTASLVSPFNHILTNNHCLPSPQDAVNVDFDFMAEAPTCDSPNCRACWPGDIYSGSTMVMTHTGYDMALVKVAEGDPASLYGYLEIDNRVPIIGEQIYNPQHSGGEAKMISYFSTHPSDTGGVARIQSITADTCLAQSGLDEVGYYLDGYGGSSGSPIIAAATHKLIALHHCSGDLNRGVASWMWYPDVEPFITGQPPLGGIAPGVTAVSADSQQSGQSPGNAIDGKIATRWASAGTSGAHWLNVDLGQLAAISGFTVWHASASGLPVTRNSRVFEIQSAPSSGGPWTTEFLGSNPLQDELSGFSYVRPRPLRHLRVLITDPGDDPAARITEFEIHGAKAMFDAWPSGSNIATQSVHVQASSAYNSSLDGDKAVDGIIDINSRWVSKAVSPPHTLTLDLGATRTISGFVLRQAGLVESPGYNADCLSFKTARSLAGPWYAETLIITTSSLNYEARTFAHPKDARYVQLEIYDPGPKNDPIARIPEFEVYEASGDTHAGFAATPTQGAGPLTVHFTDLSAGAPTTWWWEFGDGATSTEQHPDHTYLSTGSYTVGLTVSGPNGSDARTAVNHILVGGPQADFAADTTSGPAPLAVSFTDLSTGLPNQWSWIFGDGGTSTEQHPTHVYTNPGSYTVSLGITAPAGSDIETRIGFIEVLSAPGDFDLDGDVDLDDYGRLQACLTGTGLPVVGILCDDTDLDEDDDVDQQDVTLFLGCLTGAGVPAVPDCLP